MNLKSYVLRILKKKQVFCDFNRDGRKETKHELTKRDRQQGDEIVTSMLPKRLRGKGRKKYTLQLLTRTSENASYELIENETRTV